MRALRSLFSVRPGLVLTLAVWAAGLAAGWGANFYQGVASNTVPWPGGLVPYVFTTNVSPAEQAVYLDGMKEWALSANIQFVPRTTQTNYVILDFDFEQGTNSYYASVPPVMTIDNLSRAQVCHETGHLLGFQHEHVRIDRDSYIVVNFDNLDSGSTNGSGEGSGGVTGLYLIDSNSTPNGAYDFESVMHYGRTLFSSNGDSDTLDPLAPYIYKYYNRIGNFALSVGDRAGAAYLYGPPATPLTNIVSTTADGGPGSLRAAIYYANDNPGTTIRFNIPTNDPGLSNGVYTIFVSGQLPPLVSNGTVIDATTQPGYAGAPVVALDGSHVLPQTEFTIGGIYIYAGQCVLRGLAIDHFTDSGINLLYNYAASNQVQGCYIGLAADGLTAAPNDYEGVNIGAGAHANVIGGSNVISGNAGYGITLTSTNSNGNVVLGNYIGLDASGTLAVGNAYNGIGIWAGSCGNIIGGSNAGARNIISGNVDYGIYISDSLTTGTVVQGNFIGVNAGATGAVSNTGSGLCLLGGSSSNRVANNVISGNASYGLFVSDPGTSGNVIQGNFIGTDAQGASALPNGYMGIGLWSGATGNLIGGTTAAARNVISGNNQNGLGMGGAGSGGNVIEGNYIGLAGNGLSALANVGDGVYVEFSQQSNLFQSNIIAGNSYDGIEFYAASNNDVAGNYIGTGPSGLEAIPNGEYGLALFVGSPSNQITGNVVAASLNYGVFISDPGTSGNLVQGNYIGLGADGATPLGNAWQGMIIADGASNNVIGLALDGSGQGNVIADNGYQGIILYDTNTIGNCLRGNLIFSNGGIGLELVGGTQNYDGVTANHVGGAVPGPNDLENYPVLTAAAVFTNSMVIAGTMNSGPDRNVIIDIYRNPSPDPSGYGQGQTYVGTTTAQTDAAGNGSFSLPLAARLAGQSFTATATDAATGDTSEFSLDVQATNTAGPGPGELTGSSYSSSNGFRFGLTVATNQNYTIQLSTNLSAVPVLWLDLTNFFATNPTVQIFDGAATNARARFYRAVTP